ncbi:chloramphenicol-sensitive protein RarD [Streptosporangium becharense]|uniref:Chloramphenicol-sensitive protein RarD n=1 Tax=Streptosporangium becharense TaxID=1816182 RepID=A0A7W9IFS0_9ACTN|nr:EamA family transporter RarD [Streptosporangium becharense]MBB2909065.1 chloramphenicol-sensitive protein RarD [Streptosporangium becharense]MBB5819917.1 chloramphenicol-sensitive protein RarD [Streptosporangium becharense]
MPETRRGLLYGVAAYMMWGLFPLYWPLLKPSGAVEILAHRVAWSLVAVTAILAVRRHWSWFRTLVRTPRKLGLLVLAAAIITVNWGVYIYAVNSGHVVESALGYFINPLVSVLFGVLLLKERLRPLQWVAVGLGALAVLVLTFDYGRLPWIAVVLAVSFGTYGLVKKTAQVGAAESMTVETLVLLLPALGYLVYLGQQGTSTFGHVSAAHALLLAGGGVVTAVPLLCFTAAALRVPLTTIGLLQYIAPVLQFLCGVLIAREVMPPSRWIGFAIVWLALSVFTWDSLRTARRARQARQESPEAVTV